MTKTLKVIKATLYVVLFFYYLQICFWLMNRANSAANVIGMIGIVGCVAFLIFNGIDLIKQKTNKEN
jgi:hypothetical protein